MLERGGHAEMLEMFERGGHDGMLLLYRLLR